MQFYDIYFFCLFKIIPKTYNCVFPYSVILKNNKV